MRTVSGGLTRDAVRAPAWLVCAVVQLALTTVFFLVPVGTSQALVLVLLNLVTVAALLVAARRGTGAAALPWWVLGLAQLCNAAAWVCWYLYPIVVSSRTPPMLGHGIFMASYASCVVGVTLLARHRGADRRAVLDAAVLAVAVAVVLWVLVLSTEPVAGVSAWQIFSARAYVVLDLWLIAVTAMLAFSAGRLRSHLLMFVWATLQLTGDTIFYRQVFDGSFRFGSPVFAWWLLGVGALGVASLRPARTDRGTRAESFLRRGILLAALLALPGLLIVRSVQSSAEDVDVIAGASVLVTVLVLTRVLLSDRSEPLPGSARAQVRRSVRRLCAGFLVLAALPLAGLTELSLREADRTVDTEVQRRLTTSADVTAAHVTETMSGLQGLVGSYAERRLLAQALAQARVDPVDVQRHVAALESRDPDFVGAWALDARGTLVAFDPPQPAVIGNDFSYRTYFTVPRRTGTAHVSEAFEMKLPGSPRVVAVSAPVLKDGRFLGVVVLGYRLEALREFAGSLAGLQHVHLKVTDERGILLAGDGADRAGLVSARDDRHVRSALAGRSGSAREVEDGTDTLSAYRRVPELGWAVVAEIPADEAYAGANRFAGRLLAVALLLGQALLAGLVLAVRGERRRRLAEVALEEARDEALTASRLKSDFVANMSHEIRTPMNGVIGLTSLLAESRLDARQRDYVTTIQSSADALLNVINDILDFSKIEAGKLAIDPVDFDPRALAEEVSALVAPVAHKKGLEITTVVRPTIPPAVRGDAHRIRQVLTNLMSNAVKFTPGGEVVVSVEVGPPDPGTGLGTVRFSVTDTGIGIPADRQGQLFEAFTQADTSTTRVFGGTGLGLTISRHLVELMGGSIGVRSEVGKGSCFSFELPLPVAAAPLSPCTSGALAGVRVLIVDDNPTNRQVLAELLTTSGMRPQAVPDAHAALAELRAAAAQGDPYRAALLDHQIHSRDGMDGLDLARAIQADPALAATPLAMLTSTDRPSEVSAAREAGVQVYVAKPVRAAQLRATLLGLVSEAPPDDEAVPAAPARPVAGARILVAEDNAVNQQVITELLSRLGYACDVAGDGEEALELLQTRHYDAVLMDMQMPRVDGLEATRRLRRLPRPVRDVPVVALTASALTSDEQRCRDAGMDEFLSKPVRKEQLAAVLAVVLPGPDGGRTAEDGRTGDGPATGAADALDPDLVAELRALGPAIFRKVYTDWLATLPGVVELLAAGGVTPPAPRSRTGDEAVAASELLTRTAHGLRGSSGSLGAHRLAEACARVEALAPAGPALALTAALHDLQAEAETAASAVRRLLASERTPEDELSAGPELGLTRPRDVHADPPGRRA